MNANQAWAVLVTCVVVYDVLCRDGETLSEGADRWIRRHPWLARLAVGVVAFHVANLLPQKADPIHRGFNLVRGRRR